MKGSVNVQNPGFHYDKEWIGLIMEAKKIGLTLTDIRLFLNKDSKKTVIKHTSSSGK